MILQFSKFLPSIAISSYFSLSENSVIALVVEFFYPFNEHVAFVVYNIYVAASDVTHICGTYKSSSPLAIVGSILLPLALIIWTFG